MAKCQEKVMNIIYEFLAVSELSIIFSSVYYQTSRI